MVVVVMVAPFLIHLDRFDQPERVDERGRIHRDVAVTRRPFGGGATSSAWSRTYMPCPPRECSFAVLVFLGQKRELGETR
jgi:hypothetical protein